VLKNADTEAFDKGIDRFMSAAQVVTSEADGVQEDQITKHRPTSRLPKQRRMTWSVSPILGESGA